jgi:hypothetical protein
MFRVKYQIYCNGKLVGDGVDTLIHITENPKWNVFISRTIKELNTAYPDWVLDVRIASYIPITYEAAILLKSGWTGNLLKGQAD